MELPTSKCSHILKKHMMTYLFPFNSEKGAQLKTRVMHWVNYSVLFPLPTKLRQAKGISLSRIALAISNTSK